LTAVLVLPWRTVVIGSVSGALAGIVVLWIARERSARTLALTALAVFTGSFLWNFMLNVRHAGVIDGDIPFALFPISWQDVGTGVFSFAAVALLLMATTHRGEPGRHTLKVAGIASLAALVIDIYSW
jgi:hypothetical protein